MARGVCRPKSKVRLRTTRFPEEIQVGHRQLTALGQDVEITVRPTRKDHGQMSVVVA
jgi:hypothetical protein